MNGTEKTCCFVNIKYTLPPAHLQCNPGHETVLVGIPPFPQAFPRRHARTLKSIRPNFIFERNEAFIVRKRCENSNCFSNTVWFYFVEEKSERLINQSIKNPHINIYCEHLSHTQFVQLCSAHQIRSLMWCLIDRSISWLIDVLIHR